MNSLLALSALFLVFTLKIQTASAANEITQVTGVTVTADMKCGYCLTIQNTKWTYNSNQFLEYEGYSSRGAGSQEGSCCVDETTIDATGGSATVCASMLNAGGASAKAGYAILQKNAAGTYIGAIAACPFYRDTCTTIKDINVTKSTIAESDQVIALDTIGDKVYLKIDFSSAGDVGDACTWVVKAACGAPNIQIDSSLAETDLTATEVDIWVMEYSDEFTTGAATPITLTGKSGTAVYYPQDKAASVYPDPALTHKNEPADINFKPYTSDGLSYVRSVPGAVIMDWRDDIANYYTKYNELKSDYNTQNSRWTEKVNYLNSAQKVVSEGVFDWLFGTTEETIYTYDKPSDEFMTIGQPWTPTQPMAIPTDFPLIANAEAITMGYGAPTSTALDFTSKGRAWGVMQSSTEAYTATDIKQSVRKTQQPTSLTNCDASYVMIQVIYKAATSGKTKLKIDVESSAFARNLYTPTRPTAVTNPLAEPTVQGSRRLMISCILIAMIPIFTF